MNPTRVPIRIATVVAATAAVVIGLLVISQGADADGDRPSDDKPTAPDHSPDDGREDGLDDGEHVGRILAAYVAPDELVFRPAELLVGDEARAAAEADGAEAFDFYVRDGTGQVTVPVDGSVTVTAVDCTSFCEEGAPSDFESLTLTADGSDLYRLTVRDGFVVRIDAIYLP